MNKAAFGNRMRAGRARYTAEKIVIRNVNMPIMMNTMAQIWDPPESYPPPPRFQTAEMSAETMPARVRSQMGMRKKKIVLLRGEEDGGEVADMSCGG